MKLLDDIQAHQIETHRLSAEIKDNEPARWMMLLAWECIRICWYLVHGFDKSEARIKWEALKDSIEYFNNYFPRNTKIMHTPIKKITSPDSILKRRRDNE